MSLSERIRPNSEAAPWVCEEVAKLEAERDRLREALERIDAVTFTGGPEYGLALARIARAALQKAVNQLPDATKLIAENNRLRALAEKNEEAADALWAERDRLREALKEALEELDSLVQQETMSRSKWSQHIVWMEWLRSALEDAGDEK